MRGGAEAKSQGKWYKIGPGVAEIRIWDAAGAFRVVYVARFADAVYVLHCFGKKTQKTGGIDLFGLDSLVNMASAAGLRVELRIMQAA